MSIVTKNGAFVWYATLILRDINEDENTRDDYKYFAGMLYRIRKAAKAEGFESCGEVS
jgi:hypothetical protein